MDINFSQEDLKSKRFDKAVEVSAQLFLEKGIDNVKMSDIAEKCGIGVATLYRYFGTKTGIAIAAMTNMWNEIQKMFGDVFDSEIFLAQPGIKQLKDLMKMFVVLYEVHPNFVKLLSEFDQLILRERVPKSQLREYERSIFNFYPIVEKAYKAGVEDGTVRADVDFELLYLTCIHTLMELCKKFIQGELLSSDDYSLASKEMNTIIEAAVYYLKK